MGEKRSNQRPILTNMYKKFCENVPRNFGNRFHFFNAAYTDFRNPKSTADVSPELSGLCGLHGPALTGTQFTFGSDV